MNATPLITRLDGRGSLQLSAPSGYYASVLLRFMHEADGFRYYAWWVMVGRHYEDAISVTYDGTTAETIRVDLPENMPLSAESVSPHLKTNLAEGPTPIIIEE